MSCASCHDPLTAGVDRRSLPSATSLGVGYTHRNAPTVINAAYSPLWQFWDGRADSLWSQALSPPGGPGRVRRLPARRRARRSTITTATAFEGVFGRERVAGRAGRLPWPA